MRFKQKYIVGIGIGIAIVIMDFMYFWGSRWFAAVFILAVTVAWGQFWIDFFIEGKKERELEERFLDFVRNVAGAIKSGMPVPRALSHVSLMDYGSLSPHVKKLGYQIEWAIPVHKALIYFSNSTKNDIIKRCVATVIEAEQSGGNMEDVLESITASLVEIKKIKEERKARISSQVMQSYIIFFVFLGVMLVIENMLMPYMIESASTGLLGAEGSGSDIVLQQVKLRFDSMAGFIVSLTTWFSSMNGIFMMLSMIQGFFAGIVVGKLANGDLTSGFKHSLVMMTIAFLIMTTF